jgi:RecB family exonuclease
MQTETLPLAGLARPLLRVSPSALDAWRDCPRKYRHSYVDRPPPLRCGASAHFSLGVSVHNALRDWHLAPVARRTVAAAESMLDLAWVSEGYRDAAQAEAWRVRARSWVGSYVASLDPAREPYSVERKVVGLYGDTQFFGRLDRLDDRDGSLVVVDYKTGRSGVSEAEARGSWALAVYAYATERTMRRPARRVELHHVPTGEVVAYEHTVESLRRHLDRMTETAEEVRAARAALDADPGAADEAFPVVAGPHCAWCDFHRSCGPGRAAVPRQRDPWDGLGPDVVPEPEQPVAAVHADVG